MRRGYGGQPNSPTPAAFQRQGREQVNRAGRVGGGTHCQHFSVQMKQKNEKGGNTAFFGGAVLHKTLLEQCGQAPSFGSHEVFCSVLWGCYGNVCKCRETQSAAGAVIYPTLHVIQ